MSRHYAERTKEKNSVLKPNQTENAWQPLGFASTTVVQMLQSRRAAGVTGDRVVEFLEHDSVQMKSERKGQATEAIHSAAQQGLRGSSTCLPYLDTIQKSFGTHDVTGVKAYVGGPAREANTKLGALAYATNESVAFKESPDLHTAAHEATHIVQQRAGISLYAGVGQVGDVYERQADAVADAVVQGKSVQALLGQPAAKTSKTRGQIQKRDEYGTGRQRNDVCATPDNQPPARDSKPTSKTVRALQNWLLGYTAGHACANPPWRYYEVVNSYLGWDKNNYLIQYGRKYCIAFNTNAALNANSFAKRWVFRTTVFLQNALTTLIVSSYQAGKLTQLAPSRLQDVAFKSHALAYTRGGLALVLVYAPTMLPTIASIPSAEFDPKSPNFSKTIDQVVETSRYVLPVAIAEVFSVIFPAHGGGWRRAAKRDRDKFMAMNRESKLLGRVMRSLRKGEVDNFRALNKLAKGFKKFQFTDQENVRLASRVLQLVNQRRRTLAKQFRVWIKDNPDLKPHLDNSQPGWSKW